MNELANVTTEDLATVEPRVRASLANPSHPPQEPWEGLPKQVLFQESAQGMRASTWDWKLPRAVLLLVGIIILFGIALGRGH